MFGSISFTSHFRAAPAQADAVSTTHRKDVTEKDPESLLPLPENRARQQALLKAYRQTSSRREDGDAGIRITAHHVLNQFHAQAEMDVKKDEEFVAAMNKLAAAKNISNVAPGDYCARFAHGEMLNVGINVAAEAAATASSMALAFGLVKWLAPDSPMGSTPASLQGPGNVPSPVTAAAYSWKDMGYTSILAGSPFLMKPAFKDLYLGTAQAYLLKGRHDPVSAMEENFNAYLKEEYEPFKKDIPVDVKAAVEKVISRICSLYNDLRPDKAKPTNMQLNDITKTRAFIGMAEYWLKSFLPLAKYGLPLMEVPGWRDSDATLRKMLETEKLLRIYRDPVSRSQALHLPLSQACRSVEKNDYVIPAEMLSRPLKEASELTDKDDVSVWHHWHDIEDIPQKQTMFIGPPGSGKTFIKKAMKVWDTPSYDQTYQPLNQGGVAAGDPAKWRAAYQTEYITREGDLLGERTFKMFLAQYRNAHRYLDEPSWEDTEGAKRDTDPNVEKLYSECIEASYRILESCTTAMTNKVPTVDDLKTAEEIVQNIDPAFMSRFELVMVGGSDPATMREIAIKAYRALAARFCLPFTDGSPAKLDGEQQKRLLSAFLDVLDQLVEHHADKKGELRMFTDVEPVFMAIVSRLILEKDASHPRMESADIQQWVEDYFERMPNRNPYSKGKGIDKGKAPENEFRLLLRERNRLRRELEAIRKENEKNVHAKEDIGEPMQPLETASDIPAVTEQNLSQESHPGDGASSRQRTRDRFGTWIRRMAHSQAPGSV